jgi:hypothetical protein
MAATAAKKTAAKKQTAPTPPEPVELTFTLERETKGTYVWNEVEAEDGSVIVGKAYTKKPHFGSYVPGENTVMTVVLQFDEVEG